jgi:hypothetical protein
VILQVLPRYIPAQISNVYTATLHLLSLELGTTTTSAAAAAVEKGALLLGGGCLSILADKDLTSIKLSIVQSHSLLRALE